METGLKAIQCGFVQYVNESSLRDVNCEAAAADQSTDIGSSALSDFDYSQYRSAAEILVTQCLVTLLSADMLVNAVVHLDAP